MVSSWISRCATQCMTYLCIFTIVAANNTKNLTYPFVCELLFQEAYVNESAKLYESQTFVPRRTDEELLAYLSEPSACKLFKGEVFENLSSTAHNVTSEELQFPIAFSMSVHRDADQVARLIRLIYRSHNTYCIHVDKRAPSMYFRAILSIANCFGGNIYVLSHGNRVRINWGRYSLLEAVLRCAKLLLKVNTSWRYLINLSGQEMPLHTNWEYVVLLKALNGSNLVEFDDFDRFPERMPKRVRSFKWVKGSVYAAVKREFVHHVFHDQRAIAIDDILRMTRFRYMHPDETLYPTLNHNPSLGAPGACLSARKPDAADPTTWFLARYVIWLGGLCRTNYFVHTVCILGVPDLPVLVQRPELFANKFYYYFHPAAYDCMEQWIFNKWRQELVTGRLDPRFNHEIFAQLHCSRNHL